jgi:indolepyruvate ferredoxin oxidoreductase beta subunit
MLGVIAGSARLPIPADAFEAAIMTDGKSAEGNLRGFRAGLEAAQGAVGRASTKADSRDAASHDETISEGVRRLTAYQDDAYAQLYLDRLAPIRAADERANAGAALLRETARHLALRMSYEDVIRVAEAKADPARLARIASEIGARPGEPVKIVEFLKPGIEEFCSVLPPALARRILAVAERHPRIARFHWGMQVNTASVTGYLRMRLLAKLRRFRPRTHRYAHEQRDIERWLALIVEAAAVSGALALEVAECARLIKGYGDTHKRGSDNYRQIEAHVIRGALAGQIPPHQAADAIASARTAALVDPEGESLARCLGAIGTPGLPRMAAE